MKNTFVFAAAGLFAFSSPPPAAAAPARTGGSTVLVEAVGTVTAKEEGRTRAPRRKCGATTVALGSTTEEDDAAAGGTTIKVISLNTKRIFQEFGVSSDNYILLVVANTSTVSKLTLFPKKFGTVPELPVMTLTQSAFSVHKTKPNTTQGTGTVSGAATTNIFNNVSGSYSFTTTVDAKANAKTIFKVLAAGATHTGTQANKSLILSLKLTTGKFFAPM